MPRFFKLREKWPRWHHVFRRLHADARNFSSAVHYRGDRRGKTGIARDGGKLRPRGVVRPHFDGGRDGLLPVRGR